MEWNKIKIEKLSEDLKTLPHDGLIVLLLTRNKKMTILGKCYGWKFYDLEGDKIEIPLGWFAFLNPGDLELPKENYENT